MNLKYTCSICIFGSILFAQSAFAATLSCTDPFFFNELNTRAKCYFGNAPSDCAPVATGVLSLGSATAAYIAKNKLLKTMKDLYPNRVQLGLDMNGFVGSDFGYARGSAQRLVVTLDNLEKLPDGTVLYDSENRKYIKGIDKIPDMDWREHGTSKRWTMFTVDASNFEGQVLNDTKGPDNSKANLREYLQEQAKINAQKYKTINRAYFSKVGLGLSAGGLALTAFLSYFTTEEGNDKLTQFTNTCTERKPELKEIEKFASFDVDCTPRIPFYKFENFMKLDVSKRQEVLKNHPNLCESFEKLRDNFIPIKVEFEVQCRNKRPEKVAFKVNSKGPFVHTIQYKPSGDIDSVNGHFFEFSEMNATLEKENVFSLDVGRNSKPGALRTKNDAINFSLSPSPGSIQQEHMAKFIDRRNKLNNGFDDIDTSQKGLKDIVNLQKTAALHSRAYNVYLEEAQRTCKLVKDFDPFSSSVQSGGGQPPSDAGFAR